MNPKYEHQHESQSESEQTLGFLMPDWHPVHRPHFKVLQGRFCSIEPLSIEKHASKLYENLLLHNHNDSWTYLPYGPFLNFEEFCGLIQMTQSESDTLLYVILNPKGEPLGVAAYLRINPEHGVIEVGHLHFSKLLQRTPAATEAMFLMMRYIFDDLGYRRYEWKCNSLNKPSINAALRLGFTYEGTFRQHFVFKNRNRDTSWFSIIDREWPEIRNKLMKWLDPSNFDNEGKQRRRLQDF